jgi:NTE family protein
MLRQPILINNHLLVDGGVIRNVHIKEARKMGANIVIAVDVDVNEQQEPYKSQDFKTYENIINRILQLGLRARSDFILTDTEIIIKPDLKGINILDLSAENLTKAMKAGEDEATKMIPEIKRKMNLRTQALELQTGTQKSELMYDKQKDFQ